MKYFQMMMKKLKFDYFSSLSKWLFYAIANYEPNDL